jgi:hypothetical protein
MVGPYKIRSDPVSDWWTWVSNGDGTFRDQTQYPVGHQPTSVAVGGFNGDKRLDLAVSNSDMVDNTTSILLGNGDGTFQNQIRCLIGGSPFFVITADFNNDSKLDLAVTLDHDVGILLGNGDGTFQNQLIYRVGAGSCFVTAGDFRNDNKMDLTVANSDDNTISILLNLCL